MSQASFLKKVSIKLMFSAIANAASRIHTTLGPGLLESVFHAVLAYELAQRGLRTVSQPSIPVIYGAIRIDVGTALARVPRLPR